MVAKYYGIEKDELLKRKKATQRQRSVAVYLSKILSGRENAEVGRKFGITIQAVTNTLSRVRKMQEEDEKLGREITALKKTSESIKCIV